jgi:hypothetical protein
MITAMTSHERIAEFDFFAMTQLYQKAHTFWYNTARPHA